MDEVEEMCIIPEQEGVIVCSLDPLDFCQEFTTPDFSSNWLYCAMP